MKKIALFLMAAAAVIAACNKEEGPVDNGTPLNADFTISANPCIVGDEVSFEATAEGGVAPYTFNWELGSDIKLEGQSVKYTFEANNAYIVKLTVVDKNGNKAEKRKNLVVNPAPVAETGTMELVWAGKVLGYNALSAPAVADDGSVYATSQANILYKFDKDGKLLWEKNFNHSDANAKTQSTPSIDADGTVYIGTGTTNGSAKVIAFNPDGSIKWEFTDFWAPTGTTPLPSYQYQICGIGEENIYFGNTGTTGSMIAVNKTTGKRVAWIQNEGGTGGPGGGVRTGVVITKEGSLHWYGGAWGLWGAEKKTVDGANNSGVSWMWGIWNTGDSLDKSVNNTQGAIGLAVIGGKTCVIGFATDGNGPKVYAVEAATGTPVCVHYVLDSGTMDNGSVAFTKEGYIVASLNYTNGQENGGIIVVDPSTMAGTEVARYRVQEKVSGTPAVDAAGNIHFATESGNYYVVDKNCKLLLKKELSSLVSGDSRYKETFSNLVAAKVWSSPVIGDDGKVYLQFTNNDAEKKREFGALVCLEVGGCTAPGDSEWPMIGQNRRHTNCQK